MEHRWGTRQPLETLVRLDARPHCLAFACLTNASSSGAYLETDAAPPLWARICIELEWGVFRRDEVRRIPAYVVRRDASGIGLEWCEFAPPAILQLIESARLPTALVLGRQAASSEVRISTARGAARDPARIAVAP